MIPGFGGLLKQAKEMQQRMAQMQQELAGRTFVADAGGGMVTATVNGKQELLAVKIEPQAAGDVEMLEDLVRAAVNAAVRKSQDAMKEELSKVTGGLNLPGLSDMFGGGA
jgi:DNA-binding YbaB/EbfC family protein